MNLNEVSEKLLRARKEKRAMAPIRAELKDFSVSDGYKVQNLLLEQALGEGQKLCGYKMGLTSKAKQIDVGVTDPIRGFLLSSMECEKGSTLSRSSYIQPRVEPELAVVLNQRVGGREVTLRDVVGALQFVSPALEILDSRFENYKFSTPDVVADNTSAAGFMVGTTNLVSQLDSIRLLGISLKKNGIIVSTGCPAAVLGDPLLSVVALARSLAEEGRAIEKGQIILTGGITASVPFDVGDWVEAVWPGETLTFRVS